MDFKDDHKRLLFRRCCSEPVRLGGRLSSSSQSNSSEHSLRELKTSQKKLSWQKTNPSGLNGTVVRSSTFPLLTTFNNKEKNNQTFLKSLADDSEREHLPVFSNLAFNRHEVTPDQWGIQARKFQLRNRYAMDATKMLTKKELPSNPLRRKVQEITDINNVEDKGTAKILPESDDLLSESYFPYSKNQSSMRRLSVITEKSNFSRTSKTTIFDLEEENEFNKRLPSVERNYLEKPSYLEKTSRKLQDHVQITEKQFNPLETKAILLNSWFKTLELNREGKKLS